uniref:Uncharacterized protein n=1 Tax=Ascaris lumbricoides TaxID=6252 RepID=A0A0M3I0D0_ASCLU
MNHFLLDEDEETSSVATKGPRKRIGEVEEESRRRIYPRLLHKKDGTNIADAQCDANDDYLQHVFQSHNRRRQQWLKLSDEKAHSGL